MGGLIKKMGDVIERQGYGSAYMPQLVPIVGGVISIPVALISGAQIVKKLAQVIFQKLSQDHSLFKPNDRSLDGVNLLIEDMKDLSLIFLNSVANIATAGLLNFTFIIALLCVIGRKDLYDQY